MKARTTPGAHIIGGSLLILAGAALLLENTGAIDIGPVWRLWPLILIVIGIAKLRSAGSRPEQGSALWVLLLGLWCAVWMLHIAGLTFGDIWPALFIALGLSLLWKSLPGTPGAEKEPQHGT